MVSIEEWIKLKKIDVNKVEKIDRKAGFDFSQIDSFRGIENIDKLKSIAIDRDFDDCSDLVKGNLPNKIEEIKIEASSFNLSFLEDYKKLKNLWLFGNPNKNGVSPKRFDVLKNKNLAQTIEQFFMTQLNINDLSFIENYENLLELRIAMNEKYSSENLLIFNGNKNLKTLELSDAKLADLNFIDNCTNLYNLEIAGCHINKNSELKKNNFSINTLHLAGLNVINLEFLKKLKQLKDLSIADCQNITPQVFDSLNYSNLNNNLEKLKISKNKISDVSFLKNFKNLKELKLMNCDIKDYSPLKSDNLENTVENLYLDGNENLGNISFLTNYKNIQDLSFGSTSVTDISDLMDYEFVKNHRLKEITLPDSINWTLTKNGRYANTETVQKLIAQGVKVHLPGNFPYKPEIEPDAKLYVICGPPGAGKSTLINYMIKELGVKQLRKISTRDCRPDETDSKAVLKVPLSAFEEKFKKGEVLAYRELYGAKYGIDLLDIIDAYRSKGIYLTDSCDPISAFNLRNAHPDFVKVILVLTSPKLAEYGLQTRFEREHAQKRISNLEITKEKMQNIMEDRKKFLPYLFDADHLLVDLDYESNIKKLREIITEKPVNTPSRP